jgi:hypothetical protein
MWEKGLIVLFVLTMLTGCYIVPIQQQPFVPGQQQTATPEGQWVPIVLRATGGGAPPEKAINAAQARLMTERAAKLDAYRNLLEQAYGVAIRAKSSVRDFVLKDDSIRSRVEAYIRGAKVIDTRYREDGGVEVEMEVTLGYDFRQIFR